MTTFVVQSPPVLVFSPKRTPEIITYGFDFKNLMLSGEAPTSAHWYITSVKPNFNSTPVTGMIIGLPTIVGTQTYQQVGSGTDGVTYSLVAQITTNLGNVIEENALLEVTDSPYK